MFFKDMKSNFLIFGPTSHISSIIFPYILNKNNNVICMCTNTSRFRTFLKKKKFFQKKQKNLLIKKFLYNKKNIIGLSNFLKKKKIDNLIIINLYRNQNNLYKLNIKNFVSEYYVNVLFNYEIIKALIKKEIKIKRIILLSSIYAVEKPSNLMHNLNTFPIHYSLSKAALENLSKNLSNTLKDKINLICLRFGGIKGKVDKSFEKKYENYFKSKMLNNIDLIKVFKYALKIKINYKKNIIFVQKKLNNSINFINK